MNADVISNQINSLKAERKQLCMCCLFMFCGLKLKGEINKNKSKHF